MDKAGNTQKNHSSSKSRLDKAFSDYYIAIDSLHPADPAFWN